ncbi:MAG: vitamin K epoxide reductase family protein [Armatimonadota bacterium]|nr:vitamin K epoxide reductase family protein [Armatimonadota bacterium]MDR7402272.1 vitamin K epoxide reductase family protein [Armatimonadota bacterium]MDR7403483.1 vitamin K epoxide reductase family protein [Armatimonadota bacterium]MDR7437862.1 vitamin K epoxide reductase family protein [Armatimonadota bacterium]MDR7473324.1 vitamin K epoxide reductase family protein [Armatimonadota bacterium]
MSRQSPHQRRAARPPGPSPDVWLTALAGLGVLLSGYLLYARAAHAPVYCPLGGGCDVVQSSRYAAVFGLPVALLGLVYYAALFVLGARPAPPKRRWSLAVPLAGVGVGASAVFVVVQQTVLRVTCSLCLLSALLTLALLAYLVIRQPAAAPSRSWAWAGGTALAAAVFLVAGYAASAPVSADQSYAAGLARHLAATGAKFYGAYWCPHCEDQKRMFGEAAALLPYIECDPRSPQGRPDLCAAAGIRAYPTWDIGGRRYEGVLSLEDLAALSGYPQERGR